MRYKKNRRSVKPFIGVGVVVLLAIAGGAYIIVKHHDDKVALAAKAAPAKPVNTINYGPSTSQDNAANNQRKSSPSSASQTLDNGTTTSGSVNTSLSVTITRANSSGTNGAHAISAAANVAGATSGSCTFTATQSGQQAVSQTVQVEASNQNYICPSTTISLPTSGNWQLSAIFNSGGKSSPSSSWAGGSVSVN